MIKKKIRYINVLPGIKLKFPDIKLVYTNGRRLLVPLKILKVK